MRRLITASLLFAVATLLTGCEKYALDRQMEELCKKDGGITVYETVTLSPAEYEKLFTYSVRAKSPEDRYGPEYRYVFHMQLLKGTENGPEKDGSGWLARFESSIYRKSDNRLLGVSISYGRRGGDGFTFGFEPSSNICPHARATLTPTTFDRLVFLKGE